MAYDYDAYGRREPGYFDEPNQPVPEYTSYYSTEPRDTLRRKDSSSGRKRSSPPANVKMASATDRDELPAHAGVSEELLAAITEKIKREVVEHLKQTSSVEEPKPPKASEESVAPPLQRAPSNKSSSTSSPPPTARRVYTPPSPTQSAKPTNVPASSMEPARSPPSSPLEKPSGVRFSDRGPARPAAARTYSTMELSTIDQKWGRLFESDGTPTQRLGQFLRGLGNHIIDDFPPRRSIVVTPSKMAAYYASHALEKEPHPLLTIFRAQSNEHICRLYQDLGCEHHLIQEDPHSAPIVPSLTPVGFAHWMTLFILAYPEEESKRLGKVVLAMPIDADGDLVDGKPERLPKQISRHLFPEREDRSSRKLLETAILHFLDDLGSTSRRKGSITSPSLSRHSSTSQSRHHPVEIHQTTRTSPTTSKAPQPIERERKPYAGAPTNSESSSNEESIKIERDRKPYTAQPGSGKIHEQNTQTLNIPTRSGRANSTSSRTSTRAPSDIGEEREARHQRTQSTTSQNYVPVQEPRRSARRGSSPQFKNFSHSTPDDLHVTSKYGPSPTSSSASVSNPPQTFSPGSYGSNTSFPPPPPGGPPPIDIRERTRGSRDYRQDRRGTDDEIRFTGEFNSPREAEKWDRYKEEVEGDRYEGRPYERERGSVPTAPRDMRGAPAEDWYREKGPRPEYDTYGRRYA